MMNWLDIGSNNFSFLGREVHLGNRCLSFESECVDQSLLKGYWLIQLDNFINGKQVKCFVDKGTFWLGSVFSTVVIASKGKP